mgnify:CR=1 FL=1
MSGGVPVDMGRKGSIQMMAGGGHSGGSSEASEVRLAAIEKSMDELQKGTVAMMEKIMERLDSMEAKMADNEVPTQKL